MAEPLFMRRRWQPPLHIPIVLCRRTRTGEILCLFASGFGPSALGQFQRISVIRAESRGDRTIKVII